MVLTKNQGNNVIKTQATEESLRGFSSEVEDYLSGAKILEPSREIPVGDYVLYGVGMMPMGTNGDQFPFIELAPLGVEKPSAKEIYKVFPKQIAFAGMGAFTEQDFISRNRQFVQSAVTLDGKAASFDSTDEWKELIRKAFKPGEVDVYRLEGKVKIFVQQFLKGEAVEGLCREKVVYNWSLSTPDDDLSEDATEEATEEAKTTEESEK